RSRCGAFMESSGRKSGQPAANARAARALKQAQTVATVCDRLPIGAHGLRELRVLLTACYLWLIASWLPVARQDRHGTAGSLACGVSKPAFRLQIPISRDANSVFDTPQGQLGAAPRGRSPYEKRGTSCRRVESCSIASS